MSNRWVISWLVLDYWRWSMSNRWVIEAQTFSGLSITHRWHRLLTDVIDYSSMTHRLLIGCYTAHENNFSCFLVPFFFSFVILWSVLDAFFLVSKVLVDDLEMQSANHQYKWFSIVQFAKLNNVEEATVKVWSNKNDNWRYWRTLVPWKMVCHWLLLLFNNKKQQEPVANHFP